MVIWAGGQNKEIGIFADHYPPDRFGIIPQRPIIRLTHAQIQRMHTIEPLANKPIIQRNWQLNIDQ